jgi:mycothiol synthase
MRLAVRPPLGADDADEAASRLRAGDIAGAVALARGAGGHAALWVTEPDDDDAARAAAAGLVPGRQLLQMRRPLPAAAPPPEVATRPFAVGADEEAWLRVNNRAFASHPDQGAWDLETLRARMAEPWFDADGFRLYEADGRIAAFCWTKVHEDETPQLGEIYVIGVDPDYEGRGLGKALTLAGLAWLHGKGVHVGMLYVDAANTRAVTLYTGLGFSIDHRDQAFEADVG